MSASEEDGPPSYISIDEADAHVLSFENSNLQRNLTQIPHQLARNLISGRQAIVNPVLPFQPCSAMSNAVSTSSGQLDVPNCVKEMLNDDIHDQENASSDNATSEYYSEENGHCLSHGADEDDQNMTQGKTHGDEMGEEQVDQFRNRGESVSSQMPRSSVSEDLQSKRASLLESKNRYCSVEYDPSRRESIPVISPRPNLCHDDSVFSDDQPAIPRRKVSRERLVKQWSKSAPDLPDLLQSVNPPEALSPDIVECSGPMLNTSRLRAHSEEILNTGAGDDPLFSSSSKEEIEGKVYDGKSRKHSLKRSVSFQDSPLVYSIPQEKSEMQNLFSPQGEEAREFFRHRSSGYGTGSSSKGSLQSELSDQTNFSDSVITDNSVDQEDEENNHTLTSENQADLVPCLSIFQSESITQTFCQVLNPSLHVDGLEDSIKNNCEGEKKGNVPNFDLLETGSVQLPSDLPEGLTSETAVKDVTRGAEGGYLEDVTQGAKGRYSEGVTQEPEGGYLEDVAQGTNGGYLEGVTLEPEGEYLEDVTQGAEGGYSEEYSPADKIQTNHKEYALMVLEDYIKRNDPKTLSCGRSQNNCATSASGSLGLYRNEPSQELIHQYLMTLENHSDIDSILNHVSNMIIPSDSSSPSPNLQTRWTSNLQSPDVFKSFFPVLSNIKEQEESIDQKVFQHSKPPIDWRLIEKLERASRCQEDLCQDRDCMRSKKMLTTFENNIQLQSSLDKDQETILLALRCHGERCDNIKCPMPYCALLIDVEPWDSIEAISRIRQQLDIILEMTDNNTEPGRFLRLSPNCQYTGPAREGEDWMVLSPLSKSHNVVLITDISPSSRAPSVLKKMPLLDMDHQWNVYEKLRSLSHPNLVEHLWIMEQGKDILICTQFMGAGSLRQLLREREKKLPWRTTVNYMQQIISGVLALHERNIAYINWTACNILLDDTRQVAKVSNLSVSTSLESHAVDYGGMKHALPAAILPPELLGPIPQVCPLSDSWGCGCLLHELTMGHKIWYRYRHESRDTVWKKLQGKVPPIPRDLTRWPHIFQACWQPGLGMRHPLKHIQQMLMMTLIARN
ncbi:uncharacterized protein [Haliotis asinina]|uniref:uncharacterized protein n=1 Tax=Haliotis asinina TaxID=109174 RepID=UPI0035327469